MAENFQLSEDAANAMLGYGSYTLLELINSAIFTLYTGSQPAKGNMVPTGSVLAVITLDSSGNTIANGVLTVAEAFATASASGVAGCFNIVSSPGTGSVQIGNGTVGTSDANYVLGNLNIFEATTVVVNSGGTITLPASAPSSSPSSTPSNTASATPSATPSHTPSATPSATPSHTPSHTPS